MSSVTTQLQLEEIAGSHFITVRPNSDISYTKQSSKLNFSEIIAPTIWFCSGINRICSKWPNILTVKIKQHNQTRQNRNNLKHSLE